MYSKRGVGWALLPLERLTVAPYAFMSGFILRLPILVDCRPIYARANFEEADFRIEQSKIVRVWGLPVSILVAIKDP